MAEKKTAAKKAKKAKAKKPSKTELLEEKAKLYDRIRAKEKERRKLLSRFDELTKERKAAKEALGFCENEICGLGHALDEKHPLFDQKPEAQAESDDSKRPLLPATGADGAKNDWRETTLEPLALSMRYRKAFEEAGLTTLGKIADFQAKEGDWWWKKIKGLGETGREEYEDRMETFWEEHPEYCDQPSAAA